MAGRIPDRGDYTLPEQADIPQWEIDRERHQARSQLRAVLHRGGSPDELASRLAHRVVPERSAYARSNKSTAPHGAESRRRRSR